MKKRIGGRESISKRIKNSDPYAVMRCMVAALVFSVLAAVLLFANLNGSNRLLGRKMFCNVNKVISENVEKGETLVFPKTDAFGGNLGHILYEVKSGNILYNTAKDEGFSGTHIGFLKNHVFASGYSDTDLFSDIDDGNDGYTEIVSGNEKYSVCYAPVDDGEMYLFSFLPYDKLYSNETGSALLFAGLLTAIVLAGALFALLSLRGKLRANNKDANTKGKYRFLEKILHQLSDEDTKVFVYIKSNDSLETLDFGGSRDDSIITQSGAMERITSGFDGDNARKLKNAIAIAGPDKDLDVTVEKDGKKYRYVFSAQKKPDGTAVVICTAKRFYEPTVEETETDRIPMRETENYKTSCIEVFLERNMWHFLWNNEACFDNTPYVLQMQNDYDTQLEKVISAIVYKSDKPAFIRALNRHYLLECFREGKCEFAIEYRTYESGGMAGTGSLDVRIYRDKYNDEVKANFYVRSINIHP